MFLRVVYAFLLLQLIRIICSEIQITEPYRAGFLAFREVDHFKQVVDYARKEYPAEFPQVFMVDGSGVHHPRGMYSFQSYT